MSDPTPETTRLAVLLFTDIVGSTQLKTDLGTSAYKALLLRHDALFEAGIAEIANATILDHAGDGYFATFPTSTDAVRFALLFQSRMGLEPWGPVPLTTRLGIHVGEVLTTIKLGKEGVIGMTADLCARLMSLATGGQILLTRQGFDDARQFVRQGPIVGDRTPPLSWLAHGPYLFKGAADPIDVFEVGIENFSPLTPPPDSEKVKRVLRHDEEPVLGWRPAPGLPIPQRPNFTLIEKLGEGGFGEVWLAEDKRMRAKQVYKFCFNAQRLRALKREFTLFRLLKDALGQRPDIVTLLEYNLDNAPYFVVSDYAPGGNLLDWSDAKGGIATLTLDQRLDLLARIADAVAAAHSIGILHKDIKPANILIRENPDGTIQPQLADFGIGFLADRTAIQQLNITESGFTQMTEAMEGGSRRTGTRIYAPPELLMDKPFTQQGDVFALGVMYYQIVVGDMRRPIAQGWERDVREQCPGDALLCELLTADIAAATDGTAAHRVPTVFALVAMVRTVRKRLAAREAEDRARDELHAAECARQDAEAARQIAEEQARLADGVIGFLNEEVFARATPSSIPDAQVRDVIVNALLRPAIVSLEKRFADQPRLRANLSAQLGSVLELLGQYKAAEPLLNEALETRRRLLGEDHPDTITLIIEYASVLHSLGRSTEAEPLVREALEKRKRVLGEDHPDTITAISNYTLVLQSLGRSAETEPLLRESYKKRKRVLGQDHLDTIASIGSYARVLQILGRSAEAEPLHRDALEKRKRVLGEDHPHTITSISDYAFVLHSLGRSMEAEPLYREALEKCKRVQGENHPHTITSINNYAMFLCRLGRSMEAEPLGREALEKRKRVQGEEHPDTITSINNYALVLRYLGRSAEAEPLHREALEKRKRVLGQDHPDTIASIGNYAVVLQRLGRSEEAELLYREAFDRAFNSESLGPRHPGTKTHGNHLATLLDRSGKAAEAAAVREQLVDESVPDR